jgi:Asp-tRNA(Asn)/Glu-tRNA(Gln) amidotransferase B subunit
MTFTPKANSSPKSAREKWKPGRHGLTVHKAMTETTAEAEGLAMVSDGATIAALVATTLAAHPTPVAQYRAGRTQTLGFLVGQVIKASGGKAAPARVNAEVRRLLDEPPS